MASTYESPETVVISEAGPTVAALKGVSDVFSTGIKKFGEIRNAEVAANKKRQAELAKDMYINPEKYFERIQKNEGGLALQSQALDLFRKNTELSLQVRNGVGGPEVLQKRNETIKKLNQLIGYAASETEFKENWIEQGEARIKNMTNQGGASGLDGKYWSAANILAEVADGKVETTYVNNVQYYTFTGEGLEKPYKVPSVAFLGKQLPKVVQWDKSVKDALFQINLIDEDGKLTIDARKMTEEEYNKKAQEALGKVAIGFAKKDLHSVNSMTVDVMGEENLYSFGGATGEIDPLFAGSVLNKDDQKRFLDSTRKYGMINNVPPHYGIDPKPLSESNSRKFNETIGITPKELYKDFQKNPAIAWSQYFDTELPIYDINDNTVVVPEIKENKEKGIKPRPKETFRLSTTAGAKRFYTALLNVYPGIGGSKEGLGFKNKFLKLIEEKMSKPQSDATNGTNIINSPLTKNQSFTVE